MAFKKPEPAWTKLVVKTDWDFHNQQYCARILGIPKGKAQYRTVLEPVLLNANNSFDAADQGRALLKEIRGLIQGVDEGARAEAAAKTKAEIESTAKSWAKAEECSKVFIQDLLPEANAKTSESAKAFIQDSFGNSERTKPGTSGDLGVASTRRHVAQREYLK